MRYHLDTNVIIAILKNRPAVVRARMTSALAAGDTMAMSSVVLYELWYGVARSQRRREHAERLRHFLSGAITVEPFAGEDAAAAGDLRAGLEATGRPIGPYDLLIATQALRTGATLVTANTAEFARVPGLVWEDWTAAG